jgi:AbrB family looped-hinge helix DNA binding protein
MVQVLSKVSSKAQTVLPAHIRDLLKVGPGDMLRYTVTDRGVVIDKAPAVVEDDPFAVFHEWASAEDDAAFKDL